MKWGYAIERLHPAGMYPAGRYLVFWDQGYVPLDVDCLNVQVQPLWNLPCGLLEQATCEVAGFRWEFRKEGMMPSPAKELPAWSTAYPLNPQPRIGYYTVKRPESIDICYIMMVVSNGEGEAHDYAI